MTKIKERGSMWSGEFEGLLRELNPRLQVRRGSTDDTFGRAGIYAFEKGYDVDREDFDNGLNGHWNRVCSIGVNLLPERTIWDEKGHQIKRGWREALAMLHDRKLIRIPGGRDARRRMLDPHIHGYPTVVDKYGHTVGVARREWVK